MKLVYSWEAVADLARLRDFIAQHNPVAAQRIATELLARIQHLRQFPQQGRSVTLAPDPQALRDAIYGDYVIRYLVDRETIFILRIWHHYEDRP